MVAWCFHPNHFYIQFQYVFGQWKIHLSEVENNSNSFTYEKKNELKRLTASLFNKCYMTVSLQPVIFRHVLM